MRDSNSDSAGLRAVRGVFEDLGRVFQTRNGPIVRPGTLRALLYRLNSIHFRRFAQRIRRRPPYEMHYVARARVQQAVTEAGGRIIDVVDLSRGEPGKSLRYCVTRLAVPPAQPQ